MCDGMDIKCVTVDAADYPALKAALKTAVDEPGLSVLVALAPCALMVREKLGEIVVDEERCNLCGLCLDIGCPAIAPEEDAVCITEGCTGCGLCIEVCHRGALSYADGEAGR
jgi:indolepyruvate ferredoxin oxidoreductase alpha subunit